MKSEILFYSFKSGFRSSFSPVWHTWLIKFVFILAWLWSIAKSIWYSQSWYLASKIETLVFDPLAIQTFESYKLAEIKELKLIYSDPRVRVVSCGVPQRSILVPLLFLIYILMTWSLLSHVNSLFMLIDDELSSLNGWLVDTIRLSIHLGNLDRIYTSWFKKKTWYFFRNEWYMWWICWE